MIKIDQSLLQKSVGAFWQLIIYTELYDKKKPEQDTVSELFPLGQTVCITISWMDQWYIQQSAINIPVFNHYTE